MEAVARITGFPRQALLVVVMSLLVFAALAAGYGIRFATAPGTAPTQVSAQTSQAGSASTGSQPDCIQVNGHRAC